MYLLIGDIVFSILKFCEKKIIECHLILDVAQSYTVAFKAEISIITVVLFTRKNIIDSQWVTKL